MTFKAAIDFLRQHLMLILPTHTLITKNPVIYVVISEMFNFINVDHAQILFCLLTFKHFEFFSKKNNYKSYGNVFFFYLLLLLCGQSSLGWRTPRDVMGSFGFYVWKVFAVLWLSKPSLKVNLVGLQGILFN